METSGSVDLPTWVHPGNSVLRRAIRENVVSFPSQVPVLIRPLPDVQWRVVVLYLVRNWTVTRISARYGLPVWRIAQLIHEWAVRAFIAGQIQVIDGDRFSELTGQQPGGVQPEPDLAAAPRRPAPIARPKAAEPRVGVITALDLAIQGCEAERGEFWSLTAAELRSLRLSVEALEKAGSPAAGPLVARAFGGAA